MLPSHPQGMINLIPTSSHAAAGLVLAPHTHGVAGQLATKYKDIVDILPGGEATSKHDAHLTHLQPPLTHSHF